jgi:dihydropteroate synthase
LSLVWQAGGRAIACDRPLLMGIVNASPDSFSDAGEFVGASAQLEHARGLVAAGADLLDIGGESAFGGRPPVDPQEEISRVVPLVSALARLGVPLSVDTYKPVVAAAALDAGATIINDVSGLLDPELASVCAARGAGLVVMHTRVAPKGTLLDPGFYEDVVTDVVAFLRERIEVALSCGLRREQICVDPGPDFAKTPAQTVAVLRALDRVLALGFPVLMALSRKDFLGTVTGRAPRDRGAATLAALGWAADAGAHVFRVHDVAAAHDFLAVRSVLRGERALAPEEGLTPDRFPES